MRIISVHVKRIMAIALGLCMLGQFSAYAAPTSMPADPTIEAQGAVVINAANGEILYGKNANTRYYPASITKLMTALLVIERCNLDSTVTFSETATTGLEAGAVALGLEEGDQLTVRQCLYGLLLKSANEIGNALAEYVSGSVASFAALMNERAAALGCTDTHFTNPHGLNDSNHYTTPYDMALIARAAFQNVTLREIDTTLNYQFPAIKNSEARTITMGHKMMFPSDSRYYEGIIGGKTGYTSLAGNTLVTAAERNGVRLIAVVMKSNGTHYADTKALLDYGFARVAAQNGTSSGQTQTTSQTQSGTSPSAAVTGWQWDSNGWRYVKANGSYAAGEWILLNEADYWIDSNGYMATGWRLFVNGDWYYFRSSGAMATNRWVEDNGKWFYLSSNGYMLKNTTTPDGYRVGADGAWIVN